jgi:acetyltransferase-like isoleucine patch superfamily enzyme
MTYYHPLLIDPEEPNEIPRDSEIKEYIRKTQAELTERLYQNARMSRDGKNGRRIRLATLEEIEKYTKKTTLQGEILKIQNNINLVSAFGGIPEVKAFHLKNIMGANLGSKVFLSSSNIIDPYFPELLSIGDNTIFGLGASVFCHEVIDGTLYVGRVEIEQNCLVGFGSIVLPGSSIRIPKDQSEHLPKRRVQKLNFTLHDYMSKLIFPKETPFKTALCNSYLESQKSPLISQTWRQHLLRSAGIKIGKGVKIEDNVYFDTFYPENISIGDEVIIRHDSTITAHEGTVNNFRIGKIEIGNHVIIESGAKILPGVKIGDYSVIYPYTLVDRDIPPHTEYKTS